MPVIRQITSERALGGAPRPSIQVDDSIGQGLRSVGGAVMRAGSAEQDMALRRERMEMQVNEFRSDQQFRRMNESLGSDLLEAQGNMDPSGQGLTEGFVQTFDDKASKFLETVPQGLRPRFEELVATSRAGWVDQVSQQETEQRYSWYRTGITESQQQLQNQVFNNPDMFDAARSDGLRAIEMSGLPEAEKSELVRQWDEVLAATVAEREVRDAEADPTKAAGAATRLGVPGATQNGGDAMSLLREFEGFRETPYWDVNANRVGYGSDTVTAPDGTVSRVTKGTRVSRADAERDLARRAKEFESTAVGQVGIDAWSRLPAQAQAALVSVTYNYGELPNSVVGAVRGGDINAIANAVERLGSHNDGINRDRRNREAAIIRGQSGIQENAPDSMDPRYAALPLDQRLQVYDRINAAAERGRTAIETQRKAVQTATYDSLTLGIQTGEVVSEQTILGNATIDDGQKATLIKALRTQQEQNAGVSELIGAITSGQGVSVNSFDSDQTKVADRAYGRMVEATPEANRPAVTRAFVQETGYIPKPEIAIIRQGVESSNPQEFTAAMLKARDYRAMAPEHFDNADGLSNTRRDLELFNVYTENMGYSAEDASRRILARRTEEFQVNEEILGAQADKILKDVTPKDIASHFDESFLSFAPGAGADTATQSALMADYRVAFRERFFETGDEDEASALAISDMRKTWGISEISGDKQLMKYPPEKFYPAIEGGHEYLRTDAIATAQELAGVEPSATYLRPWIDPASGRNLTAEDIRAGRSPRYRLIYEREENGQRIIDMAPGTWAMTGDQVSALTQEAQERAMQEGQERRQFIEESVAPVANEAIPLMHNAASGRRAPAVEEADRAAAGGAAMGTLLPRLEIPLSEAQGVDGVEQNVRQQGQSIRNGVR